MGRRELGQRAKGLRGYGLYPVLVLAGLNFADEFDRVAFSALAPEIRDALGVGDPTIVSIVSLTGALAVMLAIPVGYLADRYSRVAMSVIAAVLWVAAAVGTGLAATVLVLGVARFLSGTGRLVNDTIHASLLSAYYPTRMMPTAMALHRLANSIGFMVAGPVVALVAEPLGYRWTFIVLSIPTLVLIALAVRLRDPGRRDPEGIDASVVTSSFLVGFRALRGNRSLRRIWVTAFLYGASAIPVTTLLSLVLETIHGVEASGRGLAQGLFGVGTALGVISGGFIARRMFDPERLGILALIFAVSIVLFGASFVAFGLVGSAAAAIALSFVVGVGLAGQAPPYFTLAAAVTDPGVRSQAYGYTLFFVASGGLAFGQLASRVAATAGLQTAVALLGTATLAGGIFALTLWRRVQADARVLANVPGG